MNEIEDKLKQLGLELPPYPPAGGIYHPIVVVGDMLYVSGQVPIRSDGSKITGKVGADLNLEEAQLAARQVGLTMLSSIKQHYGDLNKIKRLVKTLGMVNCTMDFTAQPKVINGYSQLMVDLWGEENGRGARSAVGMILPHNVAVEIEAIWQLHS